MLTLYDDVFPSLRKGGGLVDAPGRGLVGAKSEYPLRASYRHMTRPGHPRRMKIRPVVVGTPCRAGVEVGCRLVPLNARVVSGPRRCQAPRTVASRPAGQHA